MSAAHSNSPIWASDLAGVSKSPVEAPLQERFLPKLPARFIAGRAFRSR